MPLSSLSVEAFDRLLGQPLEAGGSLPVRCITQIGYSCSLDIALELDILFFGGSATRSICDHYFYLT
jgi:hypothetical protein